MKHLPIFILIFLSTPFLTFSQVDNTQWLIKKFKNADTILLVSHELIAGSTDVIIDSNRNQLALPKLIVNKKLNRAIIKEEKVISGNAIDSLLDILVRPNKNSIIEQGGCFVPRQSIVIVKGFKTSYIDLCFHCSSYETSKDLQNIPDFDNQRWTELETYFRQQRLTYELYEQIE